MRLDVVHRGLGEQARQVDARQEQVARAVPAAQGVAQRGEEAVGGSQVGWRVERRYAERSPEEVTDDAVLAESVQQFNDGNIPGQTKSTLVHGRHKARRAEALGKRNALRQQQAQRQAKRRGQPARAEAKIPGVTDLQRHAQQRVVPHADQPHHSEKLGVGADQDVLAVVELVALRPHAAGASARHRTGFEHGDRHAARGQRHRGRHAGVAGADDGYALTHVFQAIQNLRSGVSEMRCVSTRKPSRSISSSSAR